MEHSPEQNIDKGTGATTHWVKKSMAVPEFNPWNPCDVRESTDSGSYPLTSTPVS